MPAKKTTLATFLKRFDKIKLAEVSNYEFEERNKKVE